MLVAINIFLVSVALFILYLIYSVYKLRKFLERKVSEAVREAAVKSLPPLTRWIYRKLQHQFSKP